MLETMFSYESMPRHSVRVELPHGMAAIVRNAVYDQTRDRDLETVMHQMTQIGDASKAPYLAWESVRKGGRGAELVGNIIQINPVTHKTTSLSHTGFEGYFAGVTQENPTYQDILALEEHLGLLPKSGNTDNMRQKRLSELEQLKPEQIVIQDIARIGEAQIARINSLTGRMDHPYDAQHAFLDMLMGTRFDPQYGTLATHELSGSFGALLGRMRAIGRMSTRLTDTTDQFRGRTYEQLVRPLTLQYAPTPNGHIAQEYTLPSFPTPTRQTEVSLTRLELQGYHFMENIGRFGNPLIRKALPHALKRF